MDTLSETLSRSPSKELRYELGKLLSEHRHLKSGMDRVSLFESSFDAEDDRRMPRLYLLREYWRDRSAEKYRTLQASLRAMTVLVISVMDLC